MPYKACLNRYLISVDRLIRTMSKGSLEADDDRVPSDTNFVYPILHQEIGANIKSN